MNDPGLEEPLSSYGKEVDGKDKEHDDDSDIEEEEEESDYMVPSRWWFASTAFPLLAGTFGPMANAFNICAIVQNWRVSIPPGGTEEHGIDIRDPKWVIGVNAVSLVFALIANMSLLFNMARRLPFAIAQPITIIGFYMASFLLIALVSVAGGGHLHAPGVADQALSQAYYYAIFAAALYFLIACLMTVTVMGAYRGHYNKEFKLTISQRTLMLQTIAYLTYLLLGALIYCKIEKWQYLDAVYFANFTLLTVGIGDYSPMTHAGRSFLFPYAVGGIVILGLVVGSVRSLVLDRGKKKMSSRNLEKTRKAVLRRLEGQKGGLKGQMALMRMENSKFDLSLSPEESSTDEAQRREAEFHVMRVIQKTSAMERKWISLLISTTCTFFLWFIGGLVFYFTERNQDWTYFKALYFAYTSLLTIGYGDFSPMSNSGKPFFVFWSLLAVPTLTILISNMGDTVIKGIRDLTLILGELTVLPGEKGTFGDRIKVGISKVTGGRYAVGHGGRVLGKHIDKREGQMEHEYGGVTERAPGMPREPRRPGEGDDGGDGNTGSNNSAGNEKMVGRLAEDMAEEEHQQEHEARERGDEPEVDKHHHRYLLIREIRNVYGDINASPPKRYTYKEWRHFLSLLGEDEDDPASHRKPVITVPTTQEIPDSRPEIEGAVPEKALDSSAEQPLAKWSWIDNRSPLMGDKTEAEWLLERLVGKLEGELKSESTNSREKRRKTHKQGGVLQDSTAERHTGSSSGDSNGTLKERQTSAREKV